MRQARVSVAIRYRSHVPIHAQRPHTMEGYSRQRDRRLGSGVSTYTHSPLYKNCSKPFACDSILTGTTSAKTTNDRSTRFGTSGRSNSTLWSRRVLCSRCPLTYAKANIRWSPPAMRSSTPTTRSPHRWRLSATSSNTRRC